jgi:hypothetical protein
MDRKSVFEKTSGAVIVRGLQPDLGLPWLPVTSGGEFRTSREHLCKAHRDGTTYCTNCALIVLRSKHNLCICFYGFAEKFMVGSNIDQVGTAQNRKHYPPVPCCGAVHLKIVSPPISNIKRALVAGPGGLFLQKIDFPC